MNESKQWEADRYVLDDPTLDRDAFELRMLDDPELANAVAGAVLQVELLSRAVTIDAQVQNAQLRPEPNIQASTSAAVSDSGIPTSWAPSHVGQLWAALAAVLLVALSIAVASMRDLPRSGTEATAESDLADQWIHLVSDPQSTLPHENVVVDADDVSSIGDVTMDAPTEDQESASDVESDWMIDAGEEFFASGAAG
ncbi:MAG: hypothetical protein U0892_02650 [Pirellulales bacterium]